ncbi:MAG: HAMP domain-containing histidine kinase [Gemmatimonadetes bacterium]|nr:HAMP domain-containing histidine kinase [Gemmatimonadota bacterium]
MTASHPRARSALRRLKGAGPEISLALIVVLAAVSVWQAWRLVQHMRADARETSQVYGRIIAALREPEISGDLLLQIANDIDSTGIPVVITDPEGIPVAAANLPFGGSVDYDDPRVLGYIRELDRLNPPITGQDFGQIHFGSIPLGRHLTWLALLQIGLLVASVTVGIWAYRAAVDRNRERLWVAVARESAHQLGTPLMSVGAWIERLESGDERSRDIARHLAADLERLQRVAQRFERIGRPARAEPVALGALAERVAAYFEPRLPQNAHQVAIEVRAPGAGPSIQGDPVLLEWALEALVRNSVDALSGRGGNISVSVAAGDGTVSIRVADDGPGIAPEVRDRLFEPGITTKGGWGIGLALARRIVEDVHGGTLQLKASPIGATFEASLPVQSQSLA